MENEQKRLESDEYEYEDREERVLEGRRSWGRGILNENENFPLKYSENALFHYKDVELKVISGIKNGFTTEELEKIVNLSVEYIKN